MSQQQSKPGSMALVASCKQMENFKLMCPTQTTDNIMEYIDTNIHIKQFADLWKNLMKNFCENKLFTMLIIASQWEVT